MTRQCMTALVLAGLVGVGAARGQEREAVPPPIDVEAAREAAFRWLTQGAAAPRPGLERARFRRARAALLDLAFPPHRGPVLELRYPRRAPHAFAVSVSRDLKVVGYTAFDEAFVVERFREDRSPRPEVEVQAEIAARVRHEAEALRVRGEAFLAHAVRRFDERRFVLYRSDRHTASNPIVHHLAWQEEPSPGVLAVYPNRVVVALNPETGRLVAFLATDVEDVVVEPPPLDRAAASGRAEAAHPGARATHAELSLILKGGQARPVWVVVLEGGETRCVLVDAHRGDLLTPHED